MFHTKICVFDVLPRSAVALADLASLIQRQPVHLVVLTQTLEVDCFSQVVNLFKCFLVFSLLINVWDPLLIRGRKTLPILKQFLGRGLNLASWGRKCRFHLLVTPVLP